MLLYEIFDYDPGTWKFEYHDELNPKLWDGDRLKPPVRKKLMTIAAHFLDYIDVPLKTVRDIIITGSNANYNWTELSDIDLHIVLDLSDLKKTCPDFLGDYLGAKKQLWNNMHDLSIYGHPVELYAQDASEPHVASGIYSLKDQNWLIRPVARKPRIDDSAVKAKADELMKMIDSHTAGGSEPDKLQAIKDRIKRLRQTGLHDAGEYSAENLAFKVLRNSGYLEKLYDAYNDSLDQQLSLGSR